MLLRKSFHQQVSVLLIHIQPQPYMQDFLLIIQLLISINLDDIQNPPRYFYHMLD